MSELERQLDKQADEIKHLKNSLEYHEGVLRDLKWVIQEQGFAGPETRDPIVSKVYSLFTERNELFRKSFELQKDLEKAEGFLDMLAPDYWVKK